MRKVIQIENGVFLCNDGTMWERFKFEGKWMQIKPIPQTEPQEPNEGGVDIEGREDFSKCVIKYDDEYNRIAEYKLSKIEEGIEG